MESKLLGGSKMLTLVWIAEIFGWVSGGNVCQLDLEISWWINSHMKVLKYIFMQDRTTLERNT